VSPKDAQKRIVEALHRHADIDAGRIHIEAEGGKVILSGFVRSWNEKDEIEKAAWTAPGSCRRLFRAQRGPTMCQLVSDT
jgi:osmotically-inducible protein OsmY